MDIHPFESVGNLKFGNLRVETQRLLKAKPNSFRKAPGENETDAYDDIGLHLYFDAQDRLEFVEAFEPASVSLYGHKLLGRLADDVERDLDAIGLMAEETDVGRRFPRAGIALSESGGIVDGVGVHVRGYYDDEACAE